MSEVEVTNKDPEEKRYRRQYNETVAILNDKNKELDDLRKSLADISRQFEEYKTQNNETEKDKRIGELTHAVRLRDHKDAFREIGLEQGVRPNAIDAAWKLSGYQPDTDDVDRDLVKSTINQLLEVNDFLAKATEPGEAVNRSIPGEEVKQPQSNGFKPVPGMGPGTPLVNNRTPQVKKPVVGRLS